MLYFYPGPSKLYPQIKNYLVEAYDSGILSMNHRSAEFAELVKSNINLLKEKLFVPEDYTIFFVSSATESWEIIAQSLVTKASLHIYNGTFGQKWAEYSHKIHQKAHLQEYDFQKVITPTGGYAKEANIEVVCLTQNETSNGTQIDHATIQSFSQLYPQALIAVDATSSMGGLHLTWQSADIWFASVQKCFGLPAGLGLLICSPRAVAKALEINDKKYYNSFTFLYENIQNFQTNYTPNVLNVFLLNKVLKQIDTIDKIHQRTIKNAQMWYSFLEKNRLQCLAEDKTIRSDTVIAVTDAIENIKVVKDKAKAENIILGNGYGKWKNNTFRIANFPAIADEEIAELQSFLKNIKKDF
jgi:phosphoserine aminotransferase